MKYMGSKNRIAKELLSVMLENTDGVNVFYDVCCGGGNLVDKVPSKFKRVGIDNNKYVIALLNALRDGWQPPEITEEVYRFIKSNQESVEDYLVGYVGISLQYNGKPWGGFANKVKTKIDTIRDYQKEARSNVLKQSKQIQGIDFICSSYDVFSYRKDSIIYIDKPYEDTTKYHRNDFPHADFWEWCRDMAKQGYRLYISEYNAPSDFKCIWEKELSVTLAKNSNDKKATEKLFIYEETK